eukprot:6164954-Prorocentrum_lima.AAC.1
METKEFGSAIKEESCGIHQKRMTASRLRKGQFQTNILIPSLRRSMNRIHKEMKNGKFSLEYKQRRRVNVL